MVASVEPTTPSAAPADRSAMQSYRNDRLCRGFGHSALDSIQLNLPLSRPCCATEQRRGWVEERRSPIVHGRTPKCRLRRLEGPPCRLDRQIGSSAGSPPILAADVVGYSRLMGQDETGTLDRMRKLR